MSGKLLMTSISHETCIRKEILDDSTDGKKLIKAADDIFEAHCKRGFCMVKLHCGKQFEHAADKWRVKKDSTAK